MSISAGENHNAIIPALIGWMRQSKLRNGKKENVAGMAERFLENVDSRGKRQAVWTYWVSRTRILRDCYHPEHIPP